MNEEQFRSRRALKSGLRILFYGFVFFVAFVVFYPVGSGKERSTKTMCLVRLRDMTTAALLYAESHDERLPSKQWMEALKPSAVKLEFSCAKLEVEQDLKWGFALESSAAGLSVIGVEEPSKQPVFIESDVLAPNLIAPVRLRAKARHGMGSNISFVDSSVRFRNFTIAPDTFSSP